MKTLFQYSALPTPTRKQKRITQRLFEEEEEEKRHNSRRRNASSFIIHTHTHTHTHIYIYIFREKKRDEHRVVFLKSNGSRPTPRRRLLSTKKITIIQKSIVVVVVDVDGTKKRRPKKSECGLRSRPRRPKRGEMAVDECVLAKLKRQLGPVDDAEHRRDGVHVGADARRRTFSLGQI